VGEVVPELLPWRTASHGSCGAIPTNST
jgi:hypothetical protein